MASELADILRQLAASQLQTAKNLFLTQTKVRPSIFGTNNSRTYSWRMGRLWTINKRHAYWSHVWIPPPTLVSQDTYYQRLQVPSGGLQIIEPVSYVRWTKRINFHSRT
uniref:Uncharacterized protein n=1 Tax=Heterorhabditis bacteriophora TaxID=37862 RepID=A0A1I7WKG1_HETBA